MHSTVANDEAGTSLGFKEPLELPGKVLDCVGVARCGLERLPNGLDPYPSDDRDLPLLQDFDNLIQITLGVASGVAAGRPPVVRSATTSR